MTTTPLIAWHFAPSDYKLGHGDNRVIRLGKTLTHKGSLLLCRSGLHASVRAIDALNYASGELLCRVECSGKILRIDDKLVCTQRKVVAWIEPKDGNALLRRFARQCALDVLHLWDAPATVKQWIETGDVSTREAAAASWDVVKNTAMYDAVMYAATAPTRVAARWAALTATRAAARDRGATASNAMREHQNRVLTHLLTEAMR